MLKSVIGIADGIKKQPSSDVTASGGKGDGRAMPVVLSDGTLMWVGYLPALVPEGNTSIYQSIFPAWKDQKMHEDSIK